MKNIFLTLALLPFLIYSQVTTVGLIQHNAGSLDNGYVLFAPMTNTVTYLIDKCGKNVHSWTSTYKPGLSVYLLPDGSLLRTGNAANTTFTAGGTGGVIQKLNWNSSLAWSYTVSGATQCQHHDVKALPNGNILAIVWESKTVSEATLAGRNPALLGSTLWSEKIVEYQITGATTASVVWEWHVWDHLVQDFDNTKANFGSVSTSPQLVNINYNANTQADWLHFNSVDYNSTFDQILISNHNFGEIWVIDHSTTTSQAASHTGGNSGKGGDLLYRWGNPVAYSNGSSANQKLWAQHNAHWIESGSPDAGKIMVFNNSHGIPGANNYSSVEIIDPAVSASGTYSSTLPYLPSNAFWTYAASTPTAFYASNISGAQQLSNGNVLVCNGPTGEFFELDNSAAKVWDYINPVKTTGPMSQGSTPTLNSVFRAVFYPATYSGFTSQTLTAGAPIESNPNSYTCSLSTGFNEYTNDPLITFYPNPTSGYVTVNSEYPIKGIKFYNAMGQCVFEYASEQNTNTGVIDVNRFANGVYYIQLEMDSKTILKKIILMK
jgi:hypothetical protein